MLTGVAFMTTDPNLKLSALDANVILRLKLLAGLVLGEAPVMNEWY